MLGTRRRHRRLELSRLFQRPMWWICRFHHFRPPLAQLLRLRIQLEQCNYRLRLFLPMSHRLHYDLQLHYHLRLSHQKMLRFQHPMRPQ
jgi:hypothetical protein